MEPDFTTAPERLAKRHGGEEGQLVLRQTTTAIRPLRRIATHWRHVVGDVAGSAGLEASLAAAVATAAPSSSVVGIPNHRFRNWAGIHTARPKLLFKPKDAKEIIEILATAQKAGERVKVVGTCNSPADIAVTEGYMVSLEKYRRILSVNRTAGVMKVEAGLTIQDLIEEAAKNGLAMSNLGSIVRQSISGAISTGTHGTGIKSGILGTFVLEMEVINAMGEVLRCSKTENPELFNAARCGLGAIGVISTVTLQMEPAFQLHAIETPMTLEAVLSSLNTIVHSAEHSRFWWIPHTNKCWVWQANRTKQKPAPPQFALWQTIFHIVVARKLYEFLLWLGTFMPQLVPLINKLYSRLLFSKRRETVDRGDKQLTFDCLFQQYVSEWAIPITNTATAMLRLRDLIKRLNLKVHFSVEVRFTKADDIWLSPSYGRDSAWIGIIMYRPYGRDMPGTKVYFAAFEELMKDLGGRPHWAKAFTMAEDEFRESLPHWEDFKRVRAQMDPTRMFFNPYLNRIFPSPKPGSGETSSRKLSSSSAV